MTLCHCARRRSNCNSWICCMQVFENLKIVCITACVWRHIISEFQCTQYTGVSFSWYISDTHSYGAYQCLVIYVASIARSVFCSSKSCPNIEAWKLVLKFSALSLDKHTLSPHATTCMPQVFWTKKTSPEDQRMIKKSLLTETCLYTLFILFDTSLQVQLMSTQLYLILFFLLVART